MCSSQRIDGFLAVLTVTGGNYTPKPQKLPFSVTSVEGNSYLLYYAQIDLCQSSNKYRDDKVLCKNDPRSRKNRLRIPVKGRIGVVLYISYHFVLNF